jgi:hypothetical protein
MEVSRRWLLAAVTTALAGGLAGCQSNEPVPTSATTGESPTTDESEDGPTPAPDPDAIRPFAEVRSQPPREAPGTVLVGLGDEGSAEVGFDYGLRLFLSFRGAETVELTERRALLERREDCWRRDPDGPTATVVGTSRPTTLSPGESASETFYAYTPRETGRCLPAGTYSFEERIAPRFDGETAPQYLVFGIELVVADDGTLAVETTGPAPESA